MTVSKQLRKNQWGDGMSMRVGRVVFLQELFTAHVCLIPPRILYLASEREKEQGQGKALLLFHTRDRELHIHGFLGACAVTQG